MPIRSTGGRISEVSTVIACRISEHSLKPPVTTTITALN
jgi:hypothetical protein